MIQTDTQSPATQRPSALKTVRAIGQGLINLALVIWAVRDIRQRRDDEINGRRKVWLLAAFTPPVGPVAYFLFGRKRDRQSAEIAPEPIEQA